MRLHELFPNAVSGAAKGEFGYIGFQRLRMSVEMLIGSGRA